MGWKYVEQIKLELELYRSSDTIQREKISHEDECIAVLASMPRLRKLVVRLCPFAERWRKSEGKGALWRFLALRRCGITFEA